MPLYRRVLLIVIIALCPVEVWAQSSSAAKDGLTLTLGGAAQTLDQSFTSVPKWREGGEMINPPIKPLYDPGFTWAAGYIWDHAPAGVAAEWPPSGKNFPAWTS